MLSSGPANAATTSFGKPRQGSFVLAVVTSLVGSVEGETAGLGVAAIGAEALDGAARGSSEPELQAPVNKATASKAEERARGTVMSLVAA